MNATSSKSFFTALKTGMKSVSRSLGLTRGERPLKASSSNGFFADLKAGRQPASTPPSMTSKEQSLKATNSKSFFMTLKVGLQSMARYPRMTAVFIAGTLVQGFFQGLLVWALEKALTMFSNSQDLTVTMLAGAAAFILVISLLQSAGTFVAEVMSVRVANRIEVDWMWRVLDKVLTLPVRYFERNSQGNLVMSSYQDLLGLKSVTEDVGRLILYVTRLGALGIAACLISPKLALIGFVAIPLVAFPAN